MKKLTSRRNPVCVHIKKLGTSSSYRKQCGEYLCDGIKLLEEAVKCGAEIPVVLCSSHIPFPLPLSTQLYYTDFSIIDSLSSLKKPQNVLFTCKIPSAPIMSDSSATGTHILLDGLQDPGNVGTIIRTANALGIDSVMLTGSCADPYNPKAIRGSMGAIFRQNIHNVSQRDLIDFKESGMRIIGAALSDDCRDFTEISYDNAIIAIGNEGSGLSQGVLSICDDTIMIPIAQECESLNAAIAAAIIMAKARF